MLALWIYFGFDCCWVFLWWVLKSRGLTDGHSAHHILYAVVRMMPDENHKAQATYPHPQKYPPHLKSHYQQPMNQY